MRNTLALPDFSRTKICVVGDVMLDEYVWGSVERISPEAPVPAVHVKERTFSLGGAGNVAANLAGLKCKVSLLGVAGNDIHGDMLFKLLTEKRIENFLVKDASRPTTTKSRVLSQGQQLVRLDEEKLDGFDHKTYTELLKRFFALVNDVDAVIISDYDKGLFHDNFAAEIIKASNSRQVPVFVDPKSKDWKKYSGATCVTPNFKELGAAVPSYCTIDDNDCIEKIGTQVIDLYGLEHLLITKGAMGMSLISKNQGAIHIPTEAREVYDVSGAGDTVIALLAGAFGAGFSMEEAAGVANAAAGIVVSKVGTCPVTIDELEAILLERTHIESKVCTLPQAISKINRWRAQKKCIVFTNGCFDLIHIGHISLLNTAARMGDKLIVGLNSDASVKRLKGDVRPVLPENERAAIIGALECVDMVILFEEDTPLNMIRTIQPSILVKGGDYSAEEVVGHELMKQWKGRVEIVPLVEGISTSQIIDTLKHNGK